jgi:hypothetical protein
MNWQPQYQQLDLEYYGQYQNSGNQGLGSQTSSNKPANYNHSDQSRQQYIPSYMPLNQFYQSSQYSANQSVNREPMPYAFPPPPYRSIGKKRRLPNQTHMTELCRALLNEQPCQWGTTCKFAHSFADCQPRKLDSKYKTAQCTNWVQTGECNFDDRCAFLHNEQEEKMANGLRRLALPDLHLVREEIQTGLWVWKPLDSQCVVPLSLDALPTVRYVDMTPTGSNNNSPMFTGGFPMQKRSNMGPNTTIQHTSGLLATPSVTIAAQSRAQAQVLQPSQLQNRNSTQRVLNSIQANVNAVNQSIVQASSSGTQKTEKTSEILCGTSLPTPAVSQQAASSVENQNQKQIQDLAAQFQSKVMLGDLVMPSRVKEASFRRTKSA